MSDLSELKRITNERRMAFGPEDRLMSMAQVKYPWAIEIYDRMEANTWFPKSVGMNDDRQCYRGGKLTPNERRAYDSALAFVSNADGFQFTNLMQNVGQHVTAPEVSLALARQTAEEGVHVRSYQLMIDAVSDDPASVYMRYQTDKVLAEKNMLMQSQSEALRTDPTPANFARALVANIILEGVFFYSAFLTFYVLGRGGKMTGSADMIKYINRDEGGTHLDLFTKMFHTFKQENPELFDQAFYDDARKMFEQGAAIEMGWGHHIIGGGFSGLTNTIVDGFVMGRVNKCSAGIGMGPIFDNVEDTVPWFDQFSKPNGAEANFFEAKPIDYDASGLEW